MFCWCGWTGWTEKQTDNISIGDKVKYRLLYTVTALSESSYFGLLHLTKACFHWIILLWFELHRMSSNWVLFTKLPHCLLSPPTSTSWIKPSLSEILHQTNLCNKAGQCLYFYGFVSNPFLPTRGLRSKQIISFLKTKQNGGCYSPLQLWECCLISGICACRNTMMVLKVSSH